MSAAQPGPRTHGVRAGDAVTVELHGTVVELRPDGVVPMALVKLHIGEHALVPLSRVTLRQETE
jgi:hypothetical protein